LKENKTFISHLEELRKRILISAGAVIVLSVVSFYFHGEILAFLKLPFHRELIFIAPHEAFIVSLKVSLFAGLVFSIPLITYHLWKFVGAALYIKERKFAVKYVSSALLLFASGSCFGFFIVLPAGLEFLMGFGGSALTPMISVSKYISFVFLMVFIFGITFQLPLVMRMLTGAGIIEKKVLKENRRYAVVVIFIIAAILTPPDVFTQIALALPVILLYEIGLLFSKTKKEGGNLKG